MNTQPHAAPHSRASRGGAWRGFPGFSLVESLILIAIMGVLGMTVISMMGRQPAMVKETKLQSDVNSLNQLVAAYLADGGTLAGLTSPQAVIDKLKRSRAELDIRRQHTGSASGRLVDTRLRVRMSTSKPADNSQRAAWNTRKQRFEMTNQNGQAISEFYFDEALRQIDYGVDTTRRAARLRYNKENTGWIWGDTAATSGLAYNSPGGTNGSGNFTPFDPAEAEPTPPPPTDPEDDPGGGGGPGTGGSGSGSGGGSPSQPAALPTPSIQPSGGTFAYGAFPSSVTLSPNGAPGGSVSRLEFRTNGGSWKPYLGEPIAVASPDKVEARNVALDTLNYKNSGTRSASFYRLVPGFTGNSTGTWGNASGGTNLVTDTQNSVEQSIFKHGNTKLDLGNGEFLDAGTENVLTFSRKPFETILPNTWFGLGEMVMLNGTTFYSSEADGVTLSINLDMNDPAKAGVVHINLGLISTENTSDRTASADIVELRNPNTDFTISVDGVTYRLELSWATLDPGAGVSQGNQFLVYEGSSARAELRGRFVSNH